MFDKLSLGVKRKRNTSGSESWKQRCEKTLENKGVEGCAGRKKGCQKASVSTKEEAEERSEGEAGGKQIICGCKGDRSSRESEPGLGKRTDSEEMSRKVAKQERE
ncbi:MAG: hypothetical protein Q4E53_07630 [Eubacteriales bacterium]|nr:hypothetical protein [Eubacteriales bacterium]